MAKTGRRLTHIDETGAARMVDVSEKDVTSRVATAAGSVWMKPETLRVIVEGQATKGDVLAVARIAGIMAAKRTPELIPLCHNVPLSSVQVNIELQPGEQRIAITAEVETVDRTGVEMEALTAVTVGALAVYDMVKGVERGVRIEAVELLDKTGGKSGDWHR